MGPGGGNKCGKSVGVLEKEGDGRILRHLLIYNHSLLFCSVARVSSIFPGFLSCGRDESGEKEMQKKGFSKDMMHW